MKAPSPGIDRRTARRRFDRSAATYAGASRLEQEVAGRLLERLDYVKLQPQRVLDAGSGPPWRRLRDRYPQALVVALDFSLPMLKGGGGRFRLLERRRPRRVCADMARIPLRDGAVELVWSNMALHWLDDPLPALREFRRVLAPDGLLTFSTLGPDTLKELRAAAGDRLVHAFPDMHDIGDMLVAAGFAAPVMDMELLTLEYPGAGRLLADLRESGQTNARSDRPRGLSGRGFAERLKRALGAAPRATFEVVYGHAWSAAPAARAEPAAGKPKTISVFKRIP